MSNVVAFKVAQDKRGEQVADCDNGFFKIANELADALCCTALSSRESRIVWAVMRKTYGYRQSMDWICLDQLCEMTGITKDNLSRTIKGLVSRNILIKDGRKLGINKVVSEWLKKEEVVKTDNKTSQKRQVKKLSKPTIKVVDIDKTIVETDNANCQNQQPQKRDTIPKDNKQNTKARKSSLSDLDFSVFGEVTPEQIQEIIRIRKANTKKPPTQRVLNILAGEFIKANVQHGLSLSDCLDEWEFRGWQGFKADWVKASKGNRDQDIDWDSTGWGADLTIR
ncbi:replication protein [Vibrio algicola]|uniref:Bacteriophage lambda Replication protein O N-terminal domain-containing protein n=1 Tax=Vibrio algicola TaxID=2662262 RepID=A0A5Q0TMB6_9VIBR|nr:replication protein [Vibrio algicola]